MSPDNSDSDSNAMRQQIAELLEESRRLRERSDDLSKRILELHARIQTTEIDSPPDLSK
jgi:hypothetical protein